MATQQRDEIVRQKRETLTSAIDLIGQAELPAGLPDLMGKLQKLSGVSIRYANGTYNVAIAGLRVSCTAGFPAALAAWRRRAMVLDGEAA